MEEIPNSERKRLTFMLQHRGEVLNRIKQIAEDALTDGGAYIKQMALADILKEVENGK